MIHNLKTFVLLALNLQDLIAQTVNMLSMCIYQDLFLKQYKL